MKKIVTLAALLLAALTSTVYAQSDAIAVKASTNESVRMKLTATDLQVSTVVFATDTFSRIEMAEFSGSSKVGCPDLPVLNKMLEVPVGASVRVNIISEHHKTISGESIGLTHRLFPTQPARRKSDTSTPVLSINSDVYAHNAFYANQLVHVQMAGIARDRNLANLYFSPVQYNPVTNEVVLYDEVEVSVDFVGADIAATRQLKALHANPAFGAGINTINSLPATKDLNVNVPVRYTIIAHSSFRGQMDSFVAWKKRVGYMVDIHYTDESEIGTTNTAIANYLLSQYNNATADMPAPTYVLIVGDHQQIPAFAGRNSMQSDWSGGRISDLYYFTWTGNDNIPDCYYGRFSAQNVSQLTPQIEKTLYYEQYQFQSPAFLDKAMIVAGTDQGSVGDNAYTCGDPTGDYIVTNYVNGDHGYTQVHYYKNQYSQAPTATNVTTYSNGGYSASSSSNSVAVAVKNEVNEGRGWFNYSAHGDWDGFSIPAFGVNQVNSLSANNKFGVVIGNCCLTNSFQQSACFGETLLRKQGAGAVAYIGASDYTYWYQDFYWAVGYRNSVANPTYSASRLGCYDRMCHTHNESFDKWATTVGALMYAGNMAVQEAGQASMSHYYWEVYHLMGDPSLQPWMGQAQDMPLTYSATLPFTSQTYDVTTAPYAYVALTRDGEMVVAQFADANGQVSFPMSQLSIGIYELAVTAQNRRPTFREVQIVAGNGPYVLGSQLAAASDFVAGNTVSLSINLENVGTQTANLIDIYLEADTSVVSVLRNHTQAVNMAAGYSFTLDNAFSVLVKSGAADMSDCQMVARVVWDNGTDTSVVRQIIPVMAPNFAMVSTTAPSVANMSGNINIGIVTKNDGHAPAANVVSQLTCGHPAVSIANSRVEVGTVAVGATFTDNFVVSVASSFTGNHIVPFYHKVSDGLHTIVDTIEVIISDGTDNGYARPFEGFETGNFGALAWQNATPGWIVANSESYAGTYCAKSDIADVHNAEAQLSLTYTSTLSDSISFYYRVSSESSYDKFKFYIDGTQMIDASGTSSTSYTRYSAPIPAGTHEFVFEYSKDGSVSRGSDCAWIDNIYLPKTILRDRYVFDTICEGETYTYEGTSFETATLQAGQYAFEKALADGSRAYITLQVGLTVSLNVEDMSIERGTSVVLVADGASRYEWSNGETGNTIQVVPSQTTTYTVTGYVGNCSDQASVTITVTEPTEGIDAAQLTKVEVYPNPAESMVTVSSEYIDEVRLINSLGQVLGIYNVKGSRVDLYVAELPSGIYMLQVTGADGTLTTHKLIRR